MIEAALDRFRESFSLSQLEDACPGVSRDMIRKTLRNLQKERIVECLGRGPGLHGAKRVILSKEGKKEGNIPSLRNNDSHIGVRQREMTQTIIGCKDPCNYGSGKKYKKFAWRRKKRLDKAQTMSLEPLEMWMSTTK
jgi:hypothetical protein